jgi:pyrroloquinoline quinone (PQQ) biosynthesis protein C
MVIVAAMFSAPPVTPLWFNELKTEARNKIVGARFAGACRQGNVGAMQALVVGIWPFVDEFPKIIIRGASRVARKDGGNRELLNTLLRRGPQVLLGIRRDEENHRKLWIETGRALGLGFPADFQQSVLPESAAWIDLLKNESDLFAVFVSFAAIELIAETVSIDFLGSEAFTNILGTRGCEWFRVHAEHAPGMSHEELELCLAFMLRGGEPSKQDATPIIWNVVNHFIAAADAAVGIIP